MTKDANRPVPHKPAPARAPAVTRAIGILKVLGESSHPLGVNAIARAIGVVPSSCLHILRALVEEGMVHVDVRTKQYSLGLGLLMLARDMTGRSQFARAVQPELERIAREFPVTATAVEMDARERLVVVAPTRIPSTRACGRKMLRKQSVRATTGNGNGSRHWSTAWRLST